MQNENKNVVIKADLEIKDTSIPVKKTRKPRTKKADMIKKKKEMEKEKLLTTPKKRGRKPKGGKIVKGNVEIINENVTEEIIILHLKCKISDLNKNTDKINTLNSYDPNIIKHIEPYNSVNDDNKYEVISNDFNNVNLHYKENDKKKDDNDTSSKIIDKNKKKIIQQKLKELEKDLNMNNISQNSACFWCTYDYQSQSVHIPKTKFKNKYEVYGSFCSPECACAYLFKENLDTITKFERYQLLNYIYGKIYNYNKDIKPAPNPFYTLNKYYGNLNIQEYRQQLEYDRLILIIDKPLTKVYPELHEDNYEFETIYDNKIMLKKSNKQNKKDIIKDVFNV